MSEAPVSRWHAFVKSGDPALLDEILDPDVVFYSPVVFTPQRGRDVTKLYLTAAYGTLGGDASAGAGSGGDGARFAYTKQLVDGDHAVLEFETELDGKHVNGVDIITWGDSGRIVEFRVMLRPLQAVNLMHRKMAAMLEKLKAS